MAAPPTKEASASQRMASPRLSRSRTQSMSSDRPSTISHSIMSPPLSVSPEAAFIAASAASQIVTNDHDSHADLWYDQSGIDPAGETALVSNPALQLVNNFLDNLLFSFLHISKATTLSALRPAVTEILKPKLAKDAINNADEELREYLGGGDEDDYVQPQSGDHSRDWDLELVWKRTRLRCMVYSSLGDLEEEDEDYFMEQENLGIGIDEQISDVISPAVAIFLTSVMEYMGELTLTVAGQAAYHRMRTKFEKDLKEGTRTVADLADRIVVEESDMERVALDRTLGRLWRGWKKRTKQPAIMEFGQRPYSRASYGHLRQDSNLADGASPREAAREAINDVTEAKPAAEEFEDAPEHQTELRAGVKAAVPQAPEDVPLPITDNDIEEIEVPGLAHNSDEDGEGEGSIDLEATKRPKSLVLTSFAIHESGQAGRPAPLTRQRSSSLPAPRPSRFIAAVNTLRKDEDVENEPISKVAQNAPTKNQKQPLSVNTSANGMRAVHPEDIGVAYTTQDKDLTMDDDVATYENAEILTSARVSVSSSSLSREGHHKTQSVRSARIVDVAKSPVGSRSPSMDTTERFRSSSLSRASSVSALSATEEAVRPRASEQAPRSGSGTAMPPSMDRARPSMQNAATISESEEEETENKTQTFATQPWAVEESLTMERTALPGRKSSLSPPGNTKVTILNTNNWTGPFVDGAIPEVPPKSPSRTVRADNSTFPAVERTRTRESDDGPALPIQNNSSPARQLHTSGSSTSSATGRHKAVRTSEEHTPRHADSVARNFEELIQSNQTITYTLTPENMRDMDSPRVTDSSVFPRFGRSKGEDNNRSRSSSAATEAKNSNQRLAAPASHSAGDNSNGRNRPSPISIPGNSFKSGGLMSPLRSAGAKSQAKTQAPMVSPTPPKSPAKSPRLPPTMAREARIPGDSTKDFAEFIKATGPPGETRPPPIRGPNGPSADMASPVTPHAPVHPTMAQTPTQHTPENRRASTASSRTRHTPREAVVESRSDTSDLADFIRNGPPGAPVNRGGAGKLAAMGFEPAIPEARNSQASTNATENTMPSVQSSMNSHSALIKNKGPKAPSKMFEEEDMMPKRKTRRVKDPYAIDFSDEEDMLDEEEFMMHKPPPKKQEESLAEFLRNYEPPPEPPSVPIQQKVPKKKSSAPSLMNRFRSNKEAKEPAAAKKTQAQESRSLSSRGTGPSRGTAQPGYVPIQVNMPSGYDKYGMRTEGGGVGGPTNMNSGRPRVASAAASSGRVPMKKFEPRDANPISGRSTGTSDLAAFLRDSEPPPAMTASSAAQAPPAEDSSGFSRMFGRRKKA